MNFALQFFAVDLIKVLNYEYTQVRNMGEALRTFLPSKYIFLRSQNSCISTASRLSSKSSHANHLLWILETGGKNIPFFPPVSNIQRFAHDVIWMIYKYLFLLLKNTKIAPEKKTAISVFDIISCRNWSAALNRQPLYWKVCEST